MSNLIVLQVQELEPHVLLLPNVLISLGNARVEVLDVGHKLIYAAILVLPRPAICLAIHLRLRLLYQVPLALPTLRLILAHMTAQPRARLLRRVLPTQPHLPRARRRRPKVLSIERVAGRQLVVVEGRWREAALVVHAWVLGRGIELDGEVLRRLLGVGVGGGVAVRLVGAGGQLGLTVVFGEVWDVLVVV